MWIVIIVGVLLVAGLGWLFCLKGETVVFYFSEDGEVTDISDTFGDFIKKLK